jgi:hypothetical protein
MKKSFYLLAVLFAFLTIFNSCTVNKQLSAQRELDIKNSREEGSGCFVEFTDGTIKKYNTLKLMRGVMKTPHLLADGKIKIEAREIKAYQNADHYAISQLLYSPKKPSYVAIETLPGFAVRIARGNVNMYVRKFYNTQNAVDEFFVQSPDGQITEYLNTSLIPDVDVQSILREKKYIQVNSSVASLISMDTNKALTKNK